MGENLQETKGMFLLTVLKWLVALVAIFIALVKGGALNGSSTYTAESIGDLSGKSFLITGGSVGLGVASAKLLAAANAQVMLTVRSEAKGKAAIAKLLSEVPGANVSFRVLDLSDLDDVKRFVATVKDDKFTALMLNAGVMAPPYGETSQQIELQMGVNHFGHFALTLSLLPNVKRVCVVSSSASWFAPSLDYQKFLRFTGDDLDKYVPFESYSMSKLANLHFARILSQKSDVEVVASHPGWTATELQRHTIGAHIGNYLVAMTPEQGALTQVRAVLEPKLPNVAQEPVWFAPGGLMQLTGNPEVKMSTEKATNQEAAEKLWAMSEEITGIKL